MLPLIPTQASIDERRDLRAERGRRALRIEDVCALTGLSRPTVMAAMRGDISVKCENYAAIAAALGMRLVLSFEPVEAEEKSIIHLAA